MMNRALILGDFVVSAAVAKARQLWAVDARLTGAALLMLAALAAFTLGLWLDPRVVTGAPAWLKPAKFAVSTAIYMLTLAWLFTYLPEWRKTRRIVGLVTAVVLPFEVAIIALQAWRGTTSHFNFATLLDAAFFSIMGGAIVVQTLASVAVAVALWRQRLQDRALGWALRLGMTMTIVGALSGSLMSRPTEAQLAGLRATGRMTIAGAHTVGAPDGGAGLPGTGWSVKHGDLRVPHFLGLHAMQVLPLLALAVGQLRRSEAARVRLIVTAAGSYAGLFAILLWQALRGQSLVAPDLATLAVASTWLAMTIVGIRAAVSHREPARTTAIAY